MTVAIALGCVTVMVTVVLSTEATERSVFDADEASADDTETIGAVTVTVVIVGAHANIVSAATDIKEFCCTLA